ncbi:MAG: hypothetical protein CL912_02150 [Deltaproteobacteria bacterium]|nr:hypothetical protein [Deltaproteobacteria bacterium]
MEIADTIAKAACTACKQYKRKCDKAVTRCSTCTRWDNSLSQFYLEFDSHHRLDRECTYLNSAPRATAEEEITLLRARVEQLEEVISNSKFSSQSVKDDVSFIDGETGRKPACNLHSRLFFLDQRYFAHLHHKQEQLLLPMTRELAETLEPEISLPGGLSKIIYKHFDVVHWWVPIISKDTYETGFRSIHQRDDSRHSLSCGTRRHRTLRISPFTKLRK